MKSLVSTVLCPLCIWEVFVPAHFEILLKEPQLVYLTQAKVKFESPERWKGFAMCSCMHDAAHDLGQELPVLIRLFCIPLCEIYDYLIYFLIGRLSNAPESGNTKFIPFFTHSYTTLPSLLFL